MREIKFRAWNEKKQKIVGPFDVFDLNQDWDSEYGDYDIPFPPGSNTGYGEGPWMQYTGLRDKNGKEIYEGDIVRGWIPDDEKDEDFERMIIKFDEAEFFIARPDCRTAKSGLYFGSLSTCVLNNSIEVIGNIYENPEPLEPGKKEKA